VELLTEFDFEQAQQFASRNRTIQFRPKELDKQITKKVIAN
jgi:single-stranded-DNA-specific exonuclease